MQLVADSNRKIRDVFIGFPGSVHDARVFRNSSLSDTLAAKCQNFSILGDSTYPCLRHLLTPYKDTGNLSNVQKNYNKKLTHCRVVVEHTIGILKQRFRQLYHIQSHNIDFICHFIRACCVLHNMCIDYNVNYQFDNLVMDHIDNLPLNMDEEAGEEVNEIGINYRNYIAALLNL